MDREDLAERLRVTFLAELDDQVRQLNESLLALERDATATEPLRAAFRAAHTVKGAARVAGFPRVEAVCHEMESLLARLREGELTPGPTHFALLFAAADVLERAHARLANGESADPDTMDAIAAQLQAAALAGAGPEGGVAVAPPRAEAPPAPPAPAAASPEPVAAPAPAPAAAGPERENWVRLPAERLDPLLAGASELLLDASRLESRRERWRGVRQRLAQAVESIGRGDESLTALLHEADAVVDAAERDARSLRRTADLIGDAVQRLRLRPVRDATETLPRTVRDLAVASGRQVRLELRGQEVEADRVVIDALREPLLHLVRNAVDHGIEPPEERVAAGKPAEATVRVEAALAGDRLRVTISDDGRGIDAEGVRRRLAAAGRHAPAGDRELARALLAGGTSTAARTTSISGRGVGLDLVRAGLEALGGEVQLTWRPGEGTTFRLESPPSPAALRGVLVEVSSQVFGIPGSEVDRLLRVRPEDARQAEGRAVLTTTSPPTPLVSLAALLGAPLQPRPISGQTPAVLLRADGRRVALLVDELLTEEALMVRPLHLPHRDAAPHVTGGALLADGRVALVLSPASLVEAALGRAAPAVELAEPAAAAPPRVLVVDDSITTRTLEQSVLEAAGFSVATAVDGLDGWQRLQDEPFDAVVADVEMPRMDGITLCGRIRASARLAGVAVVLVTGLETAEARAQGLAAGADAYLFKSGFDQQDLLATLRQLIG